MAQRRTVRTAQTGSLVSRVWSAFSLFLTQIRSFYECESPENCVPWDNQSNEGKNLSATPAWSDPDNLFYLSRLQVRCPSPCSSAPPVPADAFYCDSTMQTWRLNCSASATCRVNASVTIDGNTVVQISQPTIIDGALRGVDNATLRISVASAGVPATLNVTACAQITAPIVVSLPTTILAYQTTTVMEFQQSCGSSPSVVTPVFDSAAWNDCDRGYTRRFSTSTSGGRVSLAVIFTPVAANLCAGQPGATPTGNLQTLDSSFPVGASVGIAVGVVVVIVAAVGIALFIRSRRRRSSENRRDAQELYTKES